MDSFVSSVLRWPVEEDCSSARCTDLKDTFEATVRSSRICLDSASTHSSFCDVIASSGQVLEPVCLPGSFKVIKNIDLC